MRHGKQIWSGDEWCDRQTGCPTVYDHWELLFGEPLDTKQATEREDHGDATDHRMPNEYVVTFACDGNYIYEPAEKV